VWTCPEPICNPKSKAYSRSKVQSSVATQSFSQCYRSNLNNFCKELPGIENDSSNRLCLQLYSPLEFLFSIAAFTTLVENFLPQLIALPKVTSSCTHSLLSISQPPCQQANSITPSSWLLICIALILPLPLDSYSLCPPPPRAPLLSPFPHPTLVAVHRSEVLGRSQQQRQCSVARPALRMRRRIEGTASACPKPITNPQPTSPPVVGLQDLVHNIFARSIEITDVSDCGSEGGVQYQGPHQHLYTLNPNPLRLDPIPHLHFHTSSNVHPDPASSACRVWCRTL